MLARMNSEDLFGGCTAPRFTPWLCDACRRVYWIEVGEPLDRPLIEMLGTPTSAYPGFLAACCRQAWEVDEGVGQEQNTMMRYVQAVASAAFNAGKKFWAEPPALSEPSSTGVDPPAASA